MLRMQFSIFAVTSLLACSVLQAEVTVPNIFGDHMVLQQKQKNKVWGRAAPQEKVVVSIAEQQHLVTADANGDWSVMLDELDAGGPYGLTIQSSNKITISDILVGEVWICSGQSNMEWRVNSGRSKVNDADLVTAGADFPQIRMINFPNTGSQEPIWTHPDSRWMVCSPETVGEFSGVGYFFGRQLHQTIDVPIGLINNAWGGSAADAWIARDLLETDDAYAPTLSKWKDMEAAYATLASKSELSEADKKRKTSLQRQMTGNQRPANIYNGVLKSHLGYGIRGAIWYQGESNARRAYQYRHVFPKMIAAWRAEWGLGDFPFYWVQLADFRAEKEEPAESDWAELREAQTMTMEKLPNTGEAVIIDAGEGKDIHPRNKLIVGQRLARWALAQQYGIDIAYHSPIYRKMEKRGNKLVLTFDHIDGGWRPFDVQQPIGFAIAGKDKQFVWATAKILPDNRIEVSSSEVADPEAVRYGWADNPICNMFDDRGLPLTPFRTDDWPGVTIDAR